MKSHDSIVHGFSRSMFPLITNHIVPFSKLGGAGPCTDKEKDPVYFVKNGALQCEAPYYISITEGAGEAY